MKRRAIRFLVLLDELLDILVMRVMLGTSWRRRTTAVLALLAWLTSGMWTARFELDYRLLDSYQQPVSRPLDLKLETAEADALADCVAAGEVLDNPNWSTVQILTHRHRAELNRAVAMSADASRLTYAANEEVPASIYAAQLLGCRGLLQLAAGQPDLAIRDWLALVKLGDAIGTSRPNQPVLIHTLIGFTYQAIGLAMLEKYSKASRPRGERAEAIATALLQRKRCVRQYVDALGVEMDVFAARTDQFVRAGNWWCNMRRYVGFYLPATRESRSEMLAEYWRLRREVWARVSSIMLSEEPTKASAQRRYEAGALANWTHPTDWIAGLFSPTAAARILLRATSATPTHLALPFVGDDHEAWDIDRRAARILQRCEW